MGKGSISEQYPGFGGIYNGGGSIPQIREAIEGSDLVLWIGNYPVSIADDKNSLQNANVKQSDFNT